MNKDFDFSDQFFHPSDKFLIDYNSVITRCVIEHDDGIYDAMNKGVSYATNDWILFLGAGDIITSPYLFNELSNLNAFQSRGFVAGGVLARLSTRTRIHRYVPGQWASFRPVVPHHQGLFTHKSLFSTSRYDISLRICADAFFFLHHASKCTTHIIPNIITEYDTRGVSSLSSNLPVVIQENSFICQSLNIKRPKSFHRRELIAILKYIICVALNPFKV